MLRNEMKVTTFRERFSELLDESYYNASELAEKLHVSRQTLSAWKTGARSPKEPTIIAIAQYFGVDEMWLMGFDVEKKPEINMDLQLFAADTKPRTEEARILAKGIDKLPQEQREQALSVIRAMFAKYADYFEEENHDA